MIIDPYTWHSVTIATITQVATDTVALTLERPRGYLFTPGQYAVVRVTTAAGKQFIRQYSFSSAVHDHALELLVQHEPGGVVSSWFCNDAVVGDRIEISQPYGGFVLESTTSPSLLIAGRVGVAPFISMLRSSQQDLSLLYSVRTRDQVCFPELLARHHVTVVETRQQPRINSSLLGAHLALDQTIYVCGSKQFVDGIVSTLHEHDVSPSQIRRELFTLQ